MRCGRRRLPGLQLRPGRLHVVSTCWASRPSTSSTRTPSCRAPTRWCCPAASPTATTSAPARIAGASPIMAAVSRFAESGGPVLGICNGFQILPEARAAPGRAAPQRAPALRVPRRLGPGRGLRRVHRRARGGRGAAPARRARRGPLPVRRGDARALEGEGRVAFRYCAPDGRGRRADGERQRLGGDVAGVYNEERNVLGLMPHPERAPRRSWATTTGGRSSPALAHLAAA